MVNRHVQSLGLGIRVATAVLEKGLKEAVVSIVVTKVVAEEAHQNTAVVPKVNHRGIEAAREDEMAKKAGAQVGREVAVKSLVKKEQDAVLLGPKEVHARVLVRALAVVRAQVDARKICLDVNLFNLIHVLLGDREFVIFL